jgi:hypothetical protein
VKQLAALKELSGWISAAPRKYGQWRDSTDKDIRKNLIWRGEVASGNAYPER